MTKTPRSFRNTRHPIVNLIFLWNSSLAAQKVVPNGCMCDFYDAVGDFCYILLQIVTTQKSIYPKR